MSGKDRRERIRNASSDELFQWLRERTKKDKKKSAKKRHTNISRIKAELRSRGLLPPSTKH